MHTFVSYTMGMVRRDTFYITYEMALRQLILKSEPLSKKNVRTKIEIHFPPKILKSKDIYIKETRYMCNQSAKSLSSRSKRPCKNYNDNERN